MSGIRGEAFVVRPSAAGSQDPIIYGRIGQDASGDENGAVSEVQYYPASAPTGPVKCDSAEIDGVATFSVILSKPNGAWGAESGSNEKGLCIGLTYSEGNPVEGKLNATDLVRLGLERSASATDAIDVITALNASHGPQEVSKDGPKAAFILCDPSEVWLLNIIGSVWVCQKVSSNSLALKAGTLTIGSQFDRSSEDLGGKLQSAGIWDGAGELAFGALFGQPADGAIRDWPTPGCAPDASSSVTLRQMFETLRVVGADAGSSLSSHVSVLSPKGTYASSHWFTATPNVVESVFKPFIFTPGAKISPLTKIPDGEAQTLLHKLHSNRKWAAVGDLLTSLERTCVDEVDRFIADHSGEPSQELDELMKDCVEAEVKFYR